MYKEAEYARTRLDGTVVTTCDGTPVLILTVGNDFNCECVNLKGEGCTYHITDLKIRGHKLGYYNPRNSDNVAHLERVPLRRDWRQGLRPDNVECVGRSMRKPSHGEIMECLSSTYPTAQEAFKLLDSGEKASVAISRKLMVYKNTTKGGYTLRLAFVGVIGGWSVKHNKWVLSDTHKALAPILKGVLGEVN